MREIALVALVLSVGRDVYVQETVVWREGLEVRLSAAMVWMIIYTPMRHARRAIYIRSPWAQTLAVLLFRLTKT
jgi:hypothetical protein